MFISAAICLAHLSACIFSHERSRSILFVVNALFFSMVTWIVQTVLVLNWLLVTQFLLGYMTPADLPVLLSFLLIYRIALNYQSRLPINVSIVFIQNGPEYYCRFSLSKVYCVPSALKVNPFPWRFSIFLIAYLFC